VILNNLGGAWRSPQFCKLLQNRSTPGCHGIGQCQPKGEEKDVVTVHVQMGSLPDGTNYAQQTIFNATAKQLVVMTTNSNYQKL
jgi:hypothetical protein